MNQRVALGGFMGTGKSTVGRLLAERMEVPFVDLDSRIEVRAGKSVAQIFADEGEPQFRISEATVLRCVLEESSSVIALGGGTLHYADNLACVKAACTLVCLEASLSVLRARVGEGTGRPKWSDIEALYQARAPGYALAHHLVSTETMEPE